MVETGDPVREHRYGRGLCAHARLGGDIDDIVCGSCRTAALDTVDHITRVAYFFDRAQPAAPPATRCAVDQPDDMIAEIETYAIDGPPRTGSRGLAGSCAAARDACEAARTLPTHRGDARSRGASRKRRSPAAWRVSESAVENDVHHGVQTIRASGDEDRRATAWLERV